MTNLKIKFNNTTQKTVISFDTESTTVFSENGVDWKPFDKTKNGDYYNECEKISFCYCWCFGILNGDKYETVIGRTADELKTVFENIGKTEKQIIIWIHNLAYDFQYLRSFFKFKNVFSKTKTQIMYAEMADYNIVFRDSLMLSGLKLEKVSDIYNINCRKLTGNLDYNKIRTYKTELTDDELKYIKNDCEIVCRYISLELEKWKTQKRIPLTKTGKVRRDFKTYLKQINKYSHIDWPVMISKMNDTADSYEIVQNAKAGGYVHANKKYVGKILENVYSYDKKSFYPSILISEKFPVEFFRKIENKDLNECLNDENHSYIFKLCLKNLKSKVDMSFLSLCQFQSEWNTKTDNGKIISGNGYITLTDADLKTVMKTYSGEFEIYEIWMAKKDYLPFQIIHFICDLYEKKEYYGNLRDTAEYKSDKWKYYDTMRTLTKIDLNSVFGMMLTQNLKEIMTVYENDEWHEIYNTQQQIKRKLFDDRYNTFFSQSWGIFTMSYARNILFNTILETDTVYSDTDCVKTTKKYDMTKYNNEYDEKLKNMCGKYGIDINKIYGIGHFVLENEYKQFKTLGAKKYVYIDEKNETKAVVSGISPDSVENVINGNLEKFKDGMEFGYDSNCKNVLYNENQKEIMINNEIINQKCGVCIFPATFKMKNTIIEIENLAKKILKEK